MQKTAEKIRELFNVIESNSSEAFYNLMERQCFFDIPGLYKDYDPDKPNDWLLKIKDRRYSYGINKNSQVLDIGCGDGYPTLIIAPYCKKITGIDFSEKRVQKSRENALNRGIKNTDFIKMSAENLDFPDNHFDVVAGTSVIEQINNPGPALREIFRVLKPGGKAVIYSQNFHDYFVDLPDKISTLSIDKKENYEIVFKMFDKNQMSEDVYVLKTDMNFSSSSFLESSMEKPKTHIEGLIINEELENEFLSFLEKESSNMNQCLHYKIKHFHTENLCSNLKAAGFQKIKIETENTEPAKKVLNSLHEKNVLQNLKPYFEEICDSFYEMCIRPDAKGDKVIIQAFKL